MDDMTKILTDSLERVKPPKGSSRAEHITWLGESLKRRETGIKKALDLLKQPPPAGETVKALRRRYAAGQKTGEDTLDRDVADQIERLEAANKALRRPSEAAGFNSDGLFAVGQELIDRDKQIQRLRAELEKQESKTNLYKDAVGEDRQKLEAELAEAQKKVREQRVWYCGWCGEGRAYDPADEDYAKKVLVVMQEHDQKCEKNPLVQQLAAAKKEVEELRPIRKVLDEGQRHE